MNTYMNTSAVSLKMTEMLKYFLSDCEGLLHLIEEKVTVKGDYMGASFAASADYKTVDEKTGSDSSIYTKAEA